MKKTLLTFAVLGLVLVPTLGTVQYAYGQFEDVNVGDFQTADPVTDLTVQGAIGVVKDVLKYVYIVFFIVAAFFIVMAAWDYLNSNGEAEKVKKAQQKVLYALVAIAIAILSFGVVSFVDSVITVNPTN